jgi:hypothetical protein
VERALAEAANSIADSCDKKLAELVVRYLIEEPRFRLAGAEEALRQFSTIAEKALQTHEQLAKELSERTVSLLIKIYRIFESPMQATAASPTPSLWKGAFSRRNTSPVNTSLGRELLELLRSYAKARYQSLVLHQITRLYVSLRGLLSDQIREVGFCRQRLTELAGLMEAKNDKEESRDRTGSSPEKCLLPPGCVDLEDAQQQLENAIGKEDLLAFDQRIQQLLQQQFQALVHVCMGPSTVVKSLAPAMLQEAITFLEPHLASTNIAEMYLAQHANKGEVTPELQEELRRTFAEAVPQSAPSREAGETAIITLPGGEPGNQLRNLLHATLPAAYILTTDRSDEILFFRERGPLSLKNLEQFGPLAEEAYRKGLAADASGLHTREDIAEWEPAQEI